MSDAYEGANLSDPILFTLAAFALLAAPGPTNTLLATAGAARGGLSAWRLVLAAVTAYGVAVACYRLVLAPFIAAMPAVGTTLKIAVALYLAWLAIRLWRSTTSLSRTSAGAREVFVATLLNPKGFVAALTLLPSGPDLPAYLAAFAAVVAAASTGWLLIGKTIAASVGERHGSLIPRVASLALLGFVGTLAASALG
ncbi:MAG: LysE family transporter [Devosia sp.]|uniref:LysE family translocator n=1 Tax=Devosia sp. TaxID=1871048 RepID=UPI001AC4C3F1|nr:LysE family transporter [Devosia sp.]MBN9317722.1 LysE family transporter [Devosia sp.]